MENIFYFCLIIQERKNPTLVSTYGKHILFSEKYQTLDSLQSTMENIFYSHINNQERNIKHLTLYNQ